jgi:hypothetical protein
MGMPELWPMRICHELPHSILANFLGRHNENAYENRAKQSHLQYQGGMFGIS